jgi:hypothetical protein
VSADESAALSRSSGIGYAVAFRVWIVRAREQLVKARENFSAAR